MQKAILYARFSPRPNSEECTSCQRQLEDLRAYCEENDLEVAGEFHDDALSGSDDMSRRPGLMDASVACKRGYVLLVRSHDRLFRDLAKAVVFRSRLEAKGVEIRSATEPAANGDDPTSKLLRNLFSAIAEYQRETIRARTKARIRQRQAALKPVSKIPPYGWQISRKGDRLEEVPTEQLVIDRICREYDAGLGYRQIARMLNHTNAPTRGKHQWNHKIVERILRRAGKVAT